LKTDNELILPLTGLFFLVVITLAFGVYFEMESVILPSRVFGLSLVFLIYFFSSFRKNKLYLSSLLFSLLSILFLFIKSDVGVLSATLFFLIFIVLTTRIVIKNTKKVSFIPVALGFFTFFINSVLLDIFNLFFVRNKLHTGYGKCFYNIFFRRFGCFELCFGRR